VWGIKLKRSRSAIQRLLSEGDLFARTRTKLTLQYSGVLILFLSLFVIIVYSLLYLFIWNDQRSRLSHLADSEIHTVQQWVDQSGDPNRRPTREIEDAFSIGADQSFYYLMSANGSMQLAGEIRPELRPFVMAFIANGGLRNGNFQTLELRAFDKTAPSVLGTISQPDYSRFLITERSLMHNGMRVGTLYIGKEVTFQYALFRWLFILLAGMALLFFVLAVWFSQIMSKKAMIPIARAYDKQREFVADASHELRTPLSVMLTSIEALQLEESVAQDAFSTKLLKGMKEEVGSMTKLAGELLLLAQSDSGGWELTHNRMIAADAASKAISKLEPLARSKSIAVKLHAPDELAVSWDEEKLIQLLVLLIDNAVKYTPEGGAVDVIMAIETDKGASQLTIEIKDTGIGIEPEAVPRIFDRFYRQDKARTRQTGGHGLGLSIARNIVEAGRGTIMVDSTVGVGTTFMIRLPL
jgi:signal transduction histidine kinase